MALLPSEQKSTARRGTALRSGKAVQRKADPVLLLFKAGFLIKVVSGRVSFGLERDVPKAVLTGIISDQLDP